MSSLYTTTFINKGGRDGYCEEKNGQHKFTVVNVLDGKDQPAGTTNPEQLFAAAIASCYNGAFLYFLDEKGLAADVTVTVELSLEPDPEDEENRLHAVIKVDAPELSEQDLTEVKKLACDKSPYTKIFAGKAKLELV